MATTREILAGLRRARALSGESLDPRVAESIVRGGLKEESERAFRSRGLELQERAFGLQEEQLEEQALAGRIGAGVQIGALGVQHFQNKRALEIAKARGLREEALIGKIFGDTKPTFGGDVASLAAAEAGVGGVAPVAQAAGPGALKTGFAGFAGASIVAAGGGNKEFQALGGAAGAFLVGAGPLGIAISGIASFLGGDDKVICSELHRQGYIPDDIMDLDRLYSLMWIDLETHVGYKLMAEPVVPTLKSSKFITKLISPFVIAWSYCMAEKMDNSVIVKYWHRYLGNMILKIFTPVCRWYGRRSLNG